MKTKGELIVACRKLMFDNDEQELIPDEKREFNITPERRILLKA